MCRPHWGIKMQMSSEQGLGGNRMGAVKKAVLGALRQAGYVLLKTEDLAKREEQTRALGHQLTMTSANLAAAEKKLEGSQAKDTDYQLLMIQQSLMASFDDMDPGFREILEFVKPYTMTSVERLYGLYKTVEFIVKAKIPGDLLECGTWRGGSMMLVAKTLLTFGDTSRTLYLYDTFEGHPKPDAEKDVDMWGNRAISEWVNYAKTDETSDWAYVSLEEVQTNMALTGYPQDKIRYVKGMVEKTAAANAPAAVAMARLDTDWYESSRVGLEVFWPILSNGGALIVDDYGHYRGQREAVDAFFAERPQLLHRVDYSCRAIQKIG